MKKRITTFEEARDYIFDTPKFTTKNKPEQTRAFLQRLGSPDKNLRIIHVAGTNGKGSVCAYLRSILEHAGFQVACFTSPHLIDVRERFVIRGELISKEQFFEAFVRIYDLLQEKDGVFTYHPTFFEFMFFIAMLVFEKAGCDYCILETGLGGRLDATNCVSQKEIAVITEIGLDHMAYLGNTKREIAEEKAGIMCEKTPVVYLKKDDTGSVFEDKANSLSCPAFSVSKSDYLFLKIKNKSIDFSYASRYYGNVQFHLNTVARYQMENCSLAVRTIEAMGLSSRIPVEVLKEAVSRTNWAGRMEEVKEEVFVDGAHNEDGIAAFLESVREDGFTGKRELLFSVVSDKDYKTMLEMIGNSDLFERIYLVHLQGSRATRVSVMQDILAACGCRMEKTYDTVKEALKDRCPVKSGERLYIAGSLYLVGEVKECLQGEKND